MNLDGPRQPTGSMSVDIEDGEPSCHPRHCDSVEMDNPGPSGARTPFYFHSQNHELAGSIQTPIFTLPIHPLTHCERLPGSQNPPRPVVLASSSPVIYSGDLGDAHQSHGLASQHGAIHPCLKPSVQDTEVASRKRKRLHDSPHTHITDHNDIVHDEAPAGGEDSQPRRRIRSRLRTPQDGEFSPLLIMSPSRDRDSSAEEETVSMFHYPTDAADPSHTIRRYFRPENPLEHGPRIMQSSSSPNVDDLEDCQRSDSASSFAEVAFASTASRTHGRLSTLSDFCVPRPFEEAERPSLGSIDLVHQRGLNAPPSFLSSGGNGGRMGGQWASREPVGSQTGTCGHPIRPRVPIPEHGTYGVSSRSATLAIEPSTTNLFFDMPLCDSPDSISPDGDGVAHYLTARGQSVCRTTSDST